MAKRAKVGRLQRGIQDADKLHARTLERLRCSDEENKKLKAQLLETTIELLRTRHVLATYQRGGGRALSKRNSR